VGSARHIVGIDLGTSNTVVAHATEGEPEPRILPIAQRSSGTTIEAAPLLPSCAFATLGGEAPPEASLGEHDGWVLGSSRRGALPRFRGAASRPRRAGSDTRGSIDVQPSYLGEATTRPPSSHPWTSPRACSSACD
jgi:hypothetical protein